MNGYEIEELYYLYRQGCPIAQALLIEYCYWQIKMMMPAYCYTMTSYQSDYKDYLQVVIIRCLLALDNYRPDRGMQVRSFISMVIQNTISSLIVKNQGKVVRERQTLFSLDDYLEVSIMLIIGFKKRWKIQIYLTSLYIYDKL